MVRLKHIPSGVGNFKLIFQAKGDNLEGFVDADRGVNLMHRKSYAGFVFLFGGYSIRQKSDTLSNTEGEYMAASKASKGTVY